MIRHEKSVGAASSALVPDQRPSECALTEEARGDEDVRELRLQSFPLLVVYLRADAAARPQKLNQDQED